MAENRTIALDDSSAFPDALQEGFLARAKSMSVRKRQIIVAEGTETRDVYLIRSGTIRIGLISPQGREVIMRDLGAGALIGELSALDGMPRSASAIALSNGELAHMPRELFLEFVSETPRVGLWIAQQISRQLRDVTERAFEWATMPVAVRVQSDILRMAHAAVGALPGRKPYALNGTKDDRLTLTMPTHAELAARIGTHREAVSRELSILAKEGLIHQKGRTLEILSLERLAALNSRMRR